MESSAIRAGGAHVALGANDTAFPDLLPGAGAADRTVHDFDPSWQLEALRQTVRFAEALVERIGRSPEPPRWKGLTFPTGTRGPAALP